MKVITGDETGLVKFVNSSKNELKPFGEQDRRLGVKAMCWIVPGDCFALLRCNSEIELWKVMKSTLRLIKTISSEIDDATGLVPLNHFAVLCYGVGGITKIHRLLEESPSMDNNVLSCFEVRGPVERAALTDFSFACGGRENDLQVWDISTGKRTWSAKNVPHDEVRLAVPIWVTDVSFLTSTGGNNIIATGTAYKHVRLYDVRVKRQPVISMEVGDYRVTRVLPLSPYSSEGPLSMCIADCGGTMHIRDMRTTRVTTSYGSAGGSLRAVDWDGNDVIATVSLDRYLRLHEVGKASLIYKAYLKNRLNCCLCVPGGDGDRRRTDDLEDEFDGSSIGDVDVLQKYVDSEDEDEDGDDDDDEDFDAEGSDSDISASDGLERVREAKDDEVEDDESGGDSDSDAGGGSSSSATGDEDEEDTSSNRKKRIVESKINSKNGGKLAIAGKSKKQKLL